MNINFKNLGYIFDATEKIWINPNYKGISYNDGDEIENRIAAIVNNASDLSVLSTELRQYCTDWPSLYHLTGTRANVVRPFESTFSNADVLEVGAGCGAITRYLGESGANVLALEGSPRRASIARSRTRDLENVTVLAEKFDQFKCTEKFDVITLIGVLEYANLFTPGDNPALSMLQMVRQLLKPDGKLIIAIENQLGLKYFAGAPEDHLGEPMIGIEGRYRKDQAQTFGRKKLTTLLKDANFNHSHFLAPFPDYKLPVSIITEAGFGTSNFDAAAFVWQGVRRDPQLPSITNFSLELAWPQVFENGFALEVSNSFIVIASSQNETLVPQNILAYHFSTDRVKQYCKSTLFIVDEFEKINVHYKLLESKFAETYAYSNLGGINFECPDKDEYILGKTLSLEFLQLVTQDGWKLSDVSLFFQKYLASLKIILLKDSIQFHLTNKCFLISGKYFDALPHNIIVTDDNGIFLIDKEWKYTDSVEIGYIVFRALMSLIQSTSVFGKPAGLAQINNGDLLRSAFTAFDWAFEEADFQKYAKKELMVQEFVAGRKITNYFDTWRESILPIYLLHDWSAKLETDLRNTSSQLLTNETKLASTANQLVSTDQRLVDAEVRLADKFYEIGVKDAQIVDQDHQIMDLHKRITEIQRSTSWQITRPIRFASRQSKRAVVLTKNIAPVIQSEGGVVTAFQRALSLYKNDGFMGVREAFRMAILKRNQTGVVNAPELRNPENLDAKEVFKKKANLELDIFLTSKQRIEFDSTTPPRISIIVVVWNSAHLTFKCLNALKQEQNSIECPAFEVIIFNNGSTDKTNELFSAVDGITVINSQENLGFLLGCNQAADAVRGDIILLLNSDAFVRAGALKAAYTTLLSDKSIGAIGARIVLPTGLLQEAGSIVWSDGSSYGYCRGEAEEFPPSMYRRKVDYCSGAFLMTPLKVWRELNGFDENFVPAYYEEVDYCLRLWESGYSVVYEPTVAVDHFEFGSEKKAGDGVNLMLKNREKLVTKHHALLSTKEHPDRKSSLFKACNLNNDKKGHLLVFDDQVPYMSLGAGLPRMRAILNAAAQNGWQVTFFAMQRPDVDWGQVQCEFDPEIEFVPNIPNQGIKDFILERLDSIDVLLVSRPTNMNILNPIFDSNPQILNKLYLIYDAEAIFADRDKLLHKIKGETMPSEFYEKAITDEIHIARHAKSVTCVSASEYTEFTQRLNVKVSILSHPISIAEIVSPFATRHGFLFVGRLLEPDSPNRMGLTWFVQHVWPSIRQNIPNAVLNVVGHVSTHCADITADGVVIHGPVADLTDVYAKARVFVAPIQFAAGIPLKIIEAAAEGLPILATTLMTQQLDWTTGIHIQDADEPILMAQKAIQLHEDNELWARQSLAALLKVQQAYSKNSFIHDLMTVLNGSK
jgi:GT2 family glycosyltransferase/2-polyprenyl-3-methyl-5-hydroxy-6-metoxy-1,4-benzoquinol methylase